MGVTLAYFFLNEQKTETLGRYEEGAERSESICCHTECSGFVFILREMENLWIFKLRQWHSFIKNFLVVAGKLSKDYESEYRVMSYKTFAVV